MGEKFSGTINKNTWKKPRWGGMRGGRGRWLGCWGEVGGKGRKLYLNNNKIKKKEAKVSNCHIEYKHNCV